MLYRSDVAHHIQQFVAGLLAVVILALSFPMSASAQGENKSVKITIGNCKGNNAYNGFLLKNDDVCIPAADYANITRYTYQESDNAILYTLGDKTIFISKSDGTVQIPALGVSESYGLKIENIIIADGVTYLPLSQLLPWMNVSVSVEDGNLMVEPDELSFWELTAELDSDKYLFNLCEDWGDTFSSRISLAAMMTFDIVVNQRFEKLTGGGETYTYEQYKDAYVEFATDDALVTDEAESVMNSIFSADKNIQTVEDLLEIDEKEVNHTIETTLFSQMMLDELAEYSEFAQAWRDARNIIKAAKYADDLLQPLKLMKINELYFHDVNDYYIYIQTLANAGGKSLAKQAALNSVASSLRDKSSMFAVQIMENSVNLLHDISEEIVIDPVKDIFKETAIGQLSIYLDAAKIFYSTVLPINGAFSGMAKIGLYSSLASDSWNNTYAYRSGSITEQDLLMMTEGYKFSLRASKKCFQTLEDTADIKFAGVISLFGDTEGLMDYRIKPINEMITKLGIAARARENDSIDNKETRTSELLEALKLCGLEGNGHFSDSEAIQTGDETLLAKYKKYFCENFAENDMVCIADVTHDGVDDMIVIAVSDEGIYDTKVFTCVNDNEIKIMYQEVGAAMHAAGCYTLLIRETPDGFYDFGHIWNGIYFGHGAITFEEFYPCPDDNKHRPSGEPESNMNDIRVVDLLQLTCHDSGEKELTDEEYEAAKITEEEYNDFNAMLQHKLLQEGFYAICDNYGLSMIPSLETDPQVVFRDAA